jgi:4-amino-4-deoxy-L-arabinose transferase-like glycosyltransferase
MKKRLIILCLIILFSGIIRLFYSDRIPSGINDDELHFVLNAKSIFYGFSNIEGNINPFQLGEMSSLIFAPIIGPLPSNIFTARLPYILTGCLTIILIYLITLKLTKNFNLAIISALVATINPWSIYVSRSSFDAPIAIFFYLLTFYLLVSKKPKYIYLSTITAFLAFNSYIGTKILLLPFIIISSYFLWKFNKKNGKHYSVAVLISLLIILNFIITLPNQSVSKRINELSTPNDSQIVNQVNLERQQSIQYQPLKFLLTNKYTVYIKNFTQKYLYNFSADILFLDGDHTTTGSLWKMGYFYYIDALMIIMGIIHLYLKNRNFLFLIGSFILLSPIPEAIRSDTIPAYVFHSSFQYPYFFILIGAGILLFWQIFSNKFIRFSLVAVYLLSFINFIDIYFFKSPMYQPESFSFSHRVISNYLKLENNKNREIYVLTREPEVLFRSYLFFTNSYQKNNFDLIKNIYSQSRDNISFNQIHFVNNNKYLPSRNNYTLIFDTDNFNFDEKESKLYISRLSDAGKLFSIYRGFTCQNYDLITYPNNLNIKSLNIEKLDEKSFCERYITI